MFLRRDQIPYTVQHYAVLAPEHPLVLDITSGDELEIVKAYIEQTKQKTDMDRGDLNKDKSGVFTGTFAINPINGKKSSQSGLPIMY